MAQVPSAIDFGPLWNFDDPVSTEVRFRELLVTVRASGDVGGTVEVMTQVARSQGLQQKFDDAHTTLDEAQGLVRADLGRARLRLLLERGRVSRSSGQPDEARPLFEEAWRLGREIGEENLAIDAAHMVALVVPPAEATRWSEEGMRAAESATDPKAKRWLGPFYNNLGWTYHDQGDFARALELFEKSVAFRQSQGSQPEIWIARWSVARAYRSLGRHEEALEAQEALRSEREAAGHPDGYVFEELGECLLALGRAEEAKSHFAHAHELLSTDPWMQRDEPARLARMAELGGVSAR